MTDISGGNSPLAAGGNMYDLTVTATAKMAAVMALEEFRLSRKLGRSDRGSGSTEVGEILRLNRERWKMTQHQLADRAGMHYTTIGKVETGDRGMSLSTFSRLAVHLPSDFSRDVIVTMSTPDGE